MIVKLNKNILIVLIVVAFGFWVKSFHYDKIENLQKKLDLNQELFVEYDANITTLKATLKQEKDKCVDSITKLKQTVIKQELEESIKEIEDEENNDIEISIGKHTLTFPE